MINRTLLLFFLIGFFFLSHQGISQTLGSQDYIVTQEDDTIFGFIQSLSDSKISFAYETKNSMEVKKFKVISLKSIVINDTLYKGIKIDPPNMPSATVLMKQILDGPVGYYKREIRKTKMWKPNEEQDFTGISGKVVIVYSYLVKDSKSFKIEKESFHEVCPQIFFDQEWIKKKFDEGKYEFGNLDQLVMDYNYLVLNPLDN